MRLIFTTAIAALLVANTGLASNDITQTIVIDTHADTTQRLIWDNFDLNHRDALGSIDIPRMRAGGMNAIFFSIWMPGDITGQKAVKDALAQIAAIRRQVQLHPQDLVLCTTAQEIDAARAKGKIAVLMGMEGGHMINNDLSNLRKFAALGVSYMTLTHMLDTDWADSSTDKPKHNGLTMFGKKVIREMNKLGMMVDVSHVSDKTFYDTLAISKAPIIASHSSCRSICDSSRNMSNAMIKALAAKGGVIQINYHAGYLSQEFSDAFEKNKTEIDLLNKFAEKKCGPNQACISLTLESSIRGMVKQGKLPKVSWEKIIEHIDHVVKLVGVDHVGLGSDFDGAIMPYGMEDASHLPQITEALLQRGYSEADIRKILGGNILRVMQEVKRKATL